MSKYNIGDVVSTAGTATNSAWQGEAEIIDLVDSGMYVLRMLTGPSKGRSTYFSAHQFVRVVSRAADKADTTERTYFDLVIDKLVKEYPDRKAMAAALAYEMGLAFGTRLKAQQED